MQEREGYGAPELSVVVPTVGRPTLMAAVQSALSQEGCRVEVIVSCDGPAELVDPSVISLDKRVRLVTSCGGRGPNSTRARGVEVAAGQFVAFLDDDDRWLAGKARSQLQVARAALHDGAAHVIVLCHCFLVREHGRRYLRAPKSVIEGSAGVADYLFRRRTIRPHESIICPSMILCDRKLFSAAPLDSTRIHEDWSWVLSAETSGAVFVTVRDVLVEFQVDSSRSSQGSTVPWTESATWFRMHPGLEPKQRRTGVLCYTVPTAVRQGAYRSALRILISDFRTTEWRAWLFAAASILIPPRLGRWLSGAEGKDLA